MSIKVTIITKKERDIRFNSIYEVHLQLTPKFVNDQMCSDSEKLQQVSAEIGSQFYKFFNEEKK